MFSIKYCMKSLSLDFRFRAGCVACGAAKHTVVFIL